jgi:hypothetical protein
MVSERTPGTFSAAVDGEICTRFSNPKPQRVEPVVSKKVDERSRQIPENRRHRSRQRNRWHVGSSREKHARSRGVVERALPDSSAATSQLTATRAGGAYHFAWPIRRPCAWNRRQESAVVPADRLRNRA